MPNINQGHGRLTWWMILESARRARKNIIPMEERKIQLAKHAHVEPEVVENTEEAVLTKEFLVTESNTI